MTAVYFCLSSWNKIRWVSVLLDIASWLATLNQPVMLKTISFIIIYYYKLLNKTIQMIHKQQAVVFSDQLQYC